MHCVRVDYPVEWPDVIVHVADSLTAVANKGVTVPSGSNSDDLAGLIAQISGGGGGGLEYETGTWTPASDIYNPTIDFAKTHAERPTFVMMSATSFSSVPASTMTMWLCAVVYDLVNTQFNGWYARTHYFYRGTSSNSNSGANLTYLDTNTGSSSSVARFLQTSTFKPWGNNSYFFRSSLTYKWLAVWGPTT